MDKFNVRVYNSLCAEFLGYVNTTKDDKDFNIHQYPNENSPVILGRRYEMLETNFCDYFIKDWNWIMFVVQKIKERIGYKTLDECSEEEWYITTRLTRSSILESKENLVIYIWDYLNWLNKNSEVNLVS